MVEARPKRTKLNLKMNDNHDVVNAETGETYDLAAVVGRIPWVDFKARPGPGMPPHQFVVLGKCDDADWDVLDFAIAKHPASYNAYFRGYQSPMRYFELGNYRCWHTALGIQMLNRCTLDSAEPPRRVKDGARPICWQEWGAPPSHQQGSGWPEEYKRKHPEMFRLPACRHGDIRVGDRVTHRASRRTGEVEAMYPEQVLAVYVRWDDGRKSFVGKAGLRTDCCAKV